MTERPTHTAFPFEVTGWSIRILLLAVTGILFLTLYPFRFYFATPQSGSAFPFLLGGWGKDAGRLDVLLNVFLFIPYGFALALNFRARGRSKAATLALVLAAGALLSYSIELLQFYIPQRDSGWEDVLTNSMGSVAGAILFDLCGPAVLRLLSACGQAVDAFLTLPRVTVILVLYLVACFAGSVPLQEAVSLNLWKPNCYLVVGNRFSARSWTAWKGEISRLEFWDQALPPDSAQNAMTGRLEDSGGPQPIASYDFSGSPPFHDRRGFLPDLDWTSKSPASAGSNGIRLDGESRLVSSAPVEAFVDDVRRTKQFSLRVVCTPSQVVGADGRIVSVSDAAPLGDFELHQDENHLVFWFRNAILLKWPHVAWNHADVFASQQTRDILVSYDGSTLSVYVNGKRLRSNYEFGSGSTLAMLIGRGKATELIGYRYIYYAIIFCPTGCLLALAWRRLAARPRSRLLSMVFGILFPSLLFEILIVTVSGRPIYLRSVVLSVALTLAGCLWTNSDGSAATRSLHSTSSDLAT
jgi:hypothetical protein